MTGIDRLSSLSPLAGTQPLGGTDARGAASGAIGEIGHRVLAWVDASARGDGAGRAAWSATAGDSGFAPDAQELARGGDVYGLRDLAAGVARDLGGSPTQEGALVRSLEDFTRAAVVQVAGLAGAPGDRQVAGIRDALAAADGAGGAGGVDEVIARLDAGTESLVRQNRD